MEIFKESVLQREKFKGAANKLLNHCFIVKKIEETRNDYFFILQNKAYFEEYFDLLGYGLKINEDSGVIGLASYSGTGRLRLKKMESILLLILRLLYIERKNELSLNEEVVVLAEAIHEKYGMLKIDTRPVIDKTSLKEAFRIFKRYNLVATIDSDITRSEARIKIHPSILFAVSSDNINELHDRISDRLDQYAKGVGRGDDDEETDED
jgi:hypothetical protein